MCEFNKQIGLDVKHLHGWRSNQKIKALNIVDQASGYQRVIPFFEPSKLLRQLLDEHWISWAGIPAEIILDPVQTNLADPMTGTAEDQGCVVRHIAADARWQLGKLKIMEVGLIESCRKLWISIIPKAKPSGWNV